MNPERAAAIQTILEWHSLSSHHPRHFAPGPGRMDWATQPAPFRGYPGSRSIPLPLLARDTAPADPDLDRDLAGITADHGLDAFHRLGRLLQDSLGLSAWKEFGGSRWALRMNPSSGNLHGEECHLLSGPWPGISERAWVGHYDPLHHALERRAELPEELWHPLAERLPNRSLLCCLTAIPWREAWKYGERAFRYLHHDTGHALACLDLAAAPLGWRVRVLEGIGADDLRRIFGLEPPEAPFAEWPLALAVIHPAGAPCDSRALADMGPNVVSTWNTLDWAGEPEALGPLPRHWPGLDAMLRITEWPVDSDDTSAEVEPPEPAALPPSPRPLRDLIHQRRSAQAMDGQSVLGPEAFRRILARTLPVPAHRPLALLPGPARVSLLLFVHRVSGVEPGLLMLVRHPGHLDLLQAACDPQLPWTKEVSAGEDLPLYRLDTGDWRQRAAELSCGQEIAGDGCLSLGMLAEFAPALDHAGPGLYPRLYWECGLLGQVLYLEAEAAGLQGTGIGCFFDDPVRQAIGLEGDGFRSLYHFTIGGALVDPRLRTAPPYAGRS